MAVLRGMGWRPDEGIGGFNKKVRQLHPRVSKDLDAKIFVLPVLLGS
jgi:hypothetical protein